ncbi:MAG: hypothetical protein ACHQ4H_14300 [Ktedonobacterales bacterium]
MAPAPIRGCVLLKAPGGTFAGAHPDVRGGYATFLRDVVLPHAATWSYGLIIVGAVLVCLVACAAFVTALRFDEPKLDLDLPCELRRIEVPAMRHTLHVAAICGAISVQKQYFRELRVVELDLPLVRIPGIAREEAQALIVQTVYEQRVVEITPRLFDTLANRVLNQQSAVMIGGDVVIVPALIHVPTPLPPRCPGWRVPEDLVAERNAEGRAAMAGGLRVRT